MKSKLKIIINILLVIQTFYTAQLSYKRSKYDFSEVVNEIKKFVSQNQDLHHSAYKNLAEIVDTYGPRMYGSEELEMVIDRLFDYGDQIGFDSVYKDYVYIDQWIRKEESLTLFDPRPVPTKIAMRGLGHSVPGNVKGEVYVVENMEEMEHNKKHIKGKILCYTYGTLKRSNKPREDIMYKAQEYGATALLIKQPAKISFNSPHTGVIRYDESLEKIPAANISAEDGHMFLRMKKRGQKIVVELKMDNETFPNKQSSNLIMEITGSEFPEQIVAFGGHSDSWDSGSQTGANDDGGGIFVCLEALRTIKLLGWQPKRTLRFIAWVGEETGRENKGSHQYAKKQLKQDQIKNHVIAFESDRGVNTPYGFGFEGKSEAREIIEQIIQNSFQSLNITTIRNDAQEGDIEPLKDLGVPTMKPLIHNEEYWTTHHSAGDSMDVMDPDDMDLNVMAIASLMYIIADMEEKLPFGYDGLNFHEVVLIGLASFLIFVLISYQCVTKKYLVKTVKKISKNVILKTEKQNKYDFQIDTQESHDNP